MKALLQIWLCALLFLCGCYSQEPTALPDAATLAGQPLTSPEFARGKELFKSQCALCHGETGRGDGWQVSKLVGPRPRDFHDAKMMVKMSPARAYVSLTDGVPRTAMESFPLLSDRDRWSLAFYVLSLGYDQNKAAQGQVAFAALGLAEPHARELATLNNQAILDDLNSRVEDEETSVQLLGYLRTIAPYQSAGAPLANFRSGLSITIETYRRGEQQKAQGLLQQAELDELASYVNVVRLRDSGLALAMEEEALALRKLLQRGAPIHEIEARAQELAASLDLADPLLSQKLSAGIGTAQTASISFSFAVDGALCLFLLLALVARRGADRSERRAVGLGLIIGLLVTVGSWVSWSAVSNSIPGYLRIFLTLASSGVICLAALPLLVATVRHFRCPPQHRLTAPISWLALLFILTGAIVIRDAMEIIPALTIIARYTPAAILGFVGAGIAIIGMVSILVALERRLSVPPRTGLLCITITTAFVMAIGGATRAAQQLGFISAGEAGFSQSPWLSLWPTEQGVLFQLIGAALCTVAILVTTLLPVRRPRHH